MNVYDLNGQTAVVTGGAQGIGLAVATRILASGGRVAGWDRDRTLLEKTVSALAAPDRTAGVPTDIADLTAVEAATAATLKRFGKIDILINNAAIVGPNAATWEYPPEAVRAVVSAGLFGTFSCCPAFAPPMTAQTTDASSISVRLPA